MISVESFCCLETGFSHVDIPEHGIRHQGLESVGCNCAHVGKWLWPIGGPLVDIWWTSDVDYGCSLYKSMPTEFQCFTIASPHKPVSDNNTRRRYPWKCGGMAALSLSTNMDDMI